MTAPAGPTPPPNPFAGPPPVAPDVLAATRGSLHRLAEQVLAAARHRWTGRIGLVPTDGGLGFEEVDTDDGPLAARLDGDELVVVRNGLEQRTRPATLAAAAAALGVEPGGPPVYPAATGGSPDDPLLLDAATVRLLAGWWAVGRAALERVAGTHPDRATGPVTLWPEHFDLALTCTRPGVDGGAVNLGVSPGDAELPAPYAYVGPWPPPDGRSPVAGGRRADPWWNAPFGRWVPAAGLPDVAALVALFDEGLQRTS